MSDNCNVEGEKKLSDNCNGLGVEKDRRGIVGIGTMIVFIAMIIVASVAAGVLINTAGSLQQQARATGEETISEVSSGVRVLAAKGLTGTANNTIQQIDLIVRPYAGTRGINLENTVIQYKSEYEVKHLKSGGGENQFGVTELQDVSGTGKYMLETMGDIVKITLEQGSSADYDNALGPSESAIITFYPNSGFKTVYGISVPPTTENKATWYEL